MPNSLPIRPDSITTNDIPPHLLPKTRSKSETLANETIIRIENAFARDRAELMAVVGHNRLHANMYTEEITNDIKWRILTPYELFETQLDYAIWHKLQFEDELLKGDRGWGSAGNPWYASLNKSGRYRISASAQIYYTDYLGAGTKYLMPELYDAGHLAAFIDEDYQLAIYNKKTDVLIEKLGVFPYRVTQTANGDFYYNFVIDLQGSTIMYFDAGTEIDLRVNLLRYDAIAAVLFTFNGTVSINYLDDHIDLI